MSDTNSVNTTPTTTRTTSMTDLHINDDEKYDKLLKLMEKMQNAQQKNYDALQRNNDLLSNNLNLALDKIKALEGTSKLKYKASVEFIGKIGLHTEDIPGGVFKFECDQKIKGCPIVYITRDDTTTQQTVSVTYTVHSHVAAYRNLVATVHHSFKVGESKGAEYEIPTRLISKQSLCFWNTHRLKVKIEATTIPIIPQLPPATAPQPQKLKLKDLLG